MNNFFDLAESAIWFVFTFGLLLIALHSFFTKDDGEDK